MKVTFSKNAIKTVKFVKEIKHLELETFYYITFIIFKLKYCNMFYFTNNYLTYKQMLRVLR